MVTPTNNNTTTMRYTTTTEEPPYECTVCNVPMLATDIRHIHTPQDNSAPQYFCSIGCYYIWANDQYEDEEQYDR